MSANEVINAAESDVLSCDACASMTDYIKTVG